MSNKQVTPQHPFRSFGVIGYRCFGEEGFRLDDPRRVNVIVGKNNAGKSAVLKAIQLFAVQWGVRELAIGFDPTADSHHGNGKPLRLRANLSYDYYRRLDGTPEWQNIVDRVQKGMPEGFDVEFGTDLESSQKATEAFSINYSALHYPSLMKFCSRLSDHGIQGTASDRELRTAMLAGLKKHTQMVAAKVLSSTLFVPVPRQFEQVKENFDGMRSFTIFDGKGVIEALAYRRSPPRQGAVASRAQESFYRVLQFVRTLLNEPNLDIEVPYGQHDIIVTIRGQRRYLREFGTGLYHLILMCTAFAFETDRTVYLEEPEIHLHPEIQRKLFRFLLEETTNRYYITTHSSVFLDESIHPDVAVFHVINDGTRSTVERVRTPAVAGRVLRDLGYKPSDLLTANGVIWVEGPSDRIYLLKWLSLADPELREGDHYVFNWFGGANLKHIGFTDDTSLSPALCLNRNAMIVVDRDAPPGCEPDKDFVKRVMAEMGEACWVTAGLEVENYVRDDRVRAAYAEVLPPLVTVGAGEKLIDVLKKNATGNLPADKMTVARTLTANMTDVDLDQLDLRDQIQRLASFIRKWNHLPLQSG